MPVDPVGTPPLGPEFQVPGLDAGRPPAANGGDFGELLVESIDRLDERLRTASTEAASLASGQAGDISTVAVEIEQARLALELAVQVRNKAVEAYQELLRMQV